jgi:hypothetical protein
MSPHIRSKSTVDLGLLLSEIGLLDRDNAAICGVAVKTIRRWRRLYQRRGIERRPSSHYPCPRCDGVALDEAAYACLLGWYLGDGHIARGRKSWLLSIANDARYEGLNEEIASLYTRVRGGRVTAVRRRRGCVLLESRWLHWPCLFPQHGPGRKHERRILLEEWQLAIVDRHPQEFLRGLFHSDGCRFVNPVVRHFKSGTRRYEYPRYMFTNESADIRQLCTDTLDRLGIPWRYSRRNTVSVARRQGVAALDAFIGPKY